MPYTTDEPRLPFARDSHTSWKAAESLRQQPAKRTKAQAALIQAYRDAGERGLTDHEAADAITRPVQSICSLRNGLADHGVNLQKAGERTGRYGKANTIWVIREH